MTVCERCGSTREFIPEECPSCHFRPETLRELATAAVLTAQSEAEGQSWGTPQTGLEVVVRDLRAGKALVLDEAELLRHEEIVAAFLDVKPRHLVWGLVLTFRPSPFHADSVHRALNSGRTRTGRSEWEKTLAESFARRPKEFARQYSVTYTSVRLIRPDVAVADGMITATGGPGVPTEEKAIVVATKEGGQWSIMASYSVVPAPLESLPKQ